MYRQKAKLLDQLQYCEDRRIPIAVILGSSEIEKGVVKIRDVATREEEEVSNLSNSVNYSVKLSVFP